MRQLGIGKGDSLAFKQLLRTLVADGTLQRLKGNAYRLAGEKNLVPGRLGMHRDGYGFVSPEAGGGPDIYVRHRNLAGALHQDRVLVQVTEVKGGGRSEGRISRIIERANHRMTGVLRTAGDRTFVVPYGTAPYDEVAIPAAERSGATIGMVVGIRLTGAGRLGALPQARIVETLGWPDEPGIDLQIIMRKYGLSEEFPPEVGEAVRAVPETVGPEDIEGREDFRSLVTVTIDGETARDFDDAISIRRHPDGHFTLWVHIADVSHYVRQGTPIDVEARRRGTSVYFPEKAIHMLPGELSTGICSLRPAVDRLCQTCVMEIDTSGAVSTARTVKGVICSDARMTYTEVAAILDGDVQARRRHAALLGEFEVMQELRDILSKRRRDRGSIDFDLPEPVIVLDDHGEMTGIKPTERNIAHHIIEEFMLVANESVASLLVDADWPSIYRIHEKPDPSKLADLDAVVHTFGYSLPQPYQDITPHDVQRLLNGFAGRAEANALQRIVLRCMMRASYSEAFGLHFGLSTRRYLHFTSPIRRYPDLVVHRTLTDAAHWRRSTADGRKQRRAELRDIAVEASALEREADAAAWELIDWKKVNFMLDRVGEEYTAIVSGIVSFGLFVELEDLYIDGLVHISTMADDFYRFIDTRHILVGERTGRRFKIGDEVRVVVADVNATTKRIDFRLVGSEGRRGRDRSPRARR